MVYYFVEALQTDTTLANIAVKKSDANYNVRQFAQLSDFLWSC